VKEIILIIEDSNDDAKILQLTLEELGIANPSWTVQSAAAAVDYMEGKFPFADREKYPLPKIIFLDLKLPGSDGFEFLSWLKARAEFADLLVIAISGLDDLLSIRRAYGLGAKSFLVKPCRPADLENLIHWFPAYWIRSSPPTG
jgi:CheY-like chemotaxis protein